MIGVLVASGGASGLLDDADVEPLAVAVDTAYTSARALAADRFAKRAGSTQGAAAVSAAAHLIAENDWRQILADAGVIAALEDHVHDVAVGLRLQTGGSMTDGQYERLVDQAVRGVGELGTTVGARISDWIVTSLRGGYTVGQITEVLTSDAELAQFAVTTAMFARKKPLSRKQARALASAQATAAANAAIEVSIPIAGYPYKRWNTMQDEKVRPAHAAAEAEVVGANEAFNVGGYSAMHPHDWSLPIGQRANCRCWLTAVQSDGSDTEAVALNTRQLRKLAADAEIPGRARMSKAELQDALLDQQCSIVASGALVAAGPAPPLAKAWCGNVRTLNRQALIARARVLEVDRGPNGRWPSDAELRDAINQKMATVRGQRAAVKAAKDAGITVEDAKKAAKPAERAVRSLAPKRPANAIDVDRNGFPREASLARSEATWRRGLENRHLEAIRVYTQGSGAFQRVALGKPTGTSRRMTDAYKRWARRLQQALERNRTAGEIMVRRDEIGSAVGRAWGRGDFAVGKTFVARSFTSTTIKPGGVTMFRKKATAIIRIRVPAGSRGGFIRPFAVQNYAHEREFLLPAGTKFRIVSIDVVDGIDNVLLEVVGHNGMAQSLTAGAGSGPSW